MPAVVLPVFVPADIKTGTISRKVFLHELLDGRKPQSLLSVA